MRATILWVVIGAGALAPQSLEAQSNIDRRGLWLALEGGAGWTRVSCDICRANRDLAPTLGVAIGTTMSPSLLIGADAIAWRASQGTVTELFGAVGLAAYWYPNPSRPLQLKGGIAYTTYRASDEDHALTGSAVGPLLGISYEWRLSNSLGLAPFATVHIASLSGELAFDGEPIASDLSLGALRFGATLVKR